MKLLLFLFLPLSACQYHGPKPATMPEIRDLLRPTDHVEYHCLLHACKTIRDTQRAIGDVRMCLDDCIAAAVTLYLKNVNSIAAQVLLRDLQNKDFRMD